MTTEQKAKAYDEAVERAKRMFSEKELNYIFPELKESEKSGDEMIRKSLAAYFAKFKPDDMWDANFSFGDIVVWFEKQGEQKSIDNLTQQEAMDIAVAKCFDEQKSDDLRTTGYWRVEDIEQNYSVNKVEPKFHEGEWITNGDYTWKIVEVKPLDYILQSQDGNIVDDTISHVDEQFHAFTIENARDGDVLALNDKTIVIFKDLYSSTTFHAYCYVKEGTFSVSQDDIPDWWNSEGFYPATKEQCDTLERAITNAGYRWDKEKKELKKIESYSLRSIIKDEPSPAIKKVVDSLTAWSEEDEKLFNRICDLIHGAAYENCETNEDGKELGEYAKMIRLLKSLKGRVQPKQEWGEWGKKYIASTIKMVEHCSFSSIGGITKAAAITWLKSLGPQTIWKPSDEQIKALEHFVRSIGESGYVSPYDNDSKLIYSLLEQLKQL